MLKNSICQFSEIEVWERVSLNFSGPFMDCEIAEIDEDDKNLNCSEKSYFGVCSQRDKNVDLEYKRRAVEFWNNDGKGANLGMLNINLNLCLLNVNYEDGLID